MTVRNVKVVVFRAWLLALFLLHGAHAATLDQMQFTVQALSPVLPLSQTLETRLRLTNRSRTPMYVFKDLSYFVTAWAYGSSGQSVDKGIFEQAWPPPIQRSDFLLLKPGQSIEYIRKESLADLGIRKAGQYRVDFHYNTDVPRSFTFGLPVWLGTQRASAVIRVVDRRARE